MRSGQRPHRRQRRRRRVLGTRVEAIRVAEALRDVEDDVVRTGSVARDTVRNEIEHEVVAQFPGDHVIAAGRVATDADAPDAVALLIVEGQTAAEDVDASDAASS